MHAQWTRAATGVLALSVLAGTLGVPAVDAFDGTPEPSASPPVASPPVPTPIPSLEPAPSSGATVAPLPSITAAPSSTATATPIPSPTGASTQAVVPAVAFAPGYYVGYAWNAEFTIIVSQAGFQPLVSTSATADAERLIGGSTYRRLTSGPIAGRWVVVQGDQAVATSAPTVTLSFPAGQFIGSTYDSAFAKPTGTKKYTALSPSSAPATDKREIGGLPYIRVVGGALTSHWVRFSGTTAVRAGAPLPSCAHQNIPTRYIAHGDHWRTLLDWAHAVPSTYRPSDLSSVSSWGVLYSTAYGVPSARAITRSDYLAMYQAARAAGVTLRVNTAYRSYETQASFWASSGDPYRTARPGHSEHQLGTTFDLGSSSYGWLASNSWRYGFVVSYPEGKQGVVCFGYENWHLRYVGRTVAAHVRASGLTLREWIWYTQGPHAAPGRVVRHAGADRYATAAAISAATFGAGVPVVYVATGSDFPDGLAGGVAAARAGGPLLLVSRGFVPPATATELRRLRPGRIIILGGSGVVSGAVASSLGAFTPSVTRLSGPDRYATAAAVSKAAFPAGAPIAYLATGTGFADALAASPVAHRAGGPLLLTTPGSLAPAVATELARLRASRVVIVGGTGAISSTVETSLRNRGLIVTRVSGADRYATAAALSRGFPRGTLTYLASGTGFPDALAGGVAAARSGQPMLLTSATSLPGATAAEVDRLAPPWITVLGGTGAVSAAVASAAASAAR